MSARALFFDLGGVVVEFDSDRLMLQMAQLLGRPFDEVQSAVYHAELLLPFEIGHLSPHAYYQGLTHRLKLPWTYDQFVRYWNDIFHENKDVAALLQRLHPRHRLLALTNTNVLHLQHIKATVPSASLFHGWVASCEVGCRKPDPHIYRLALERAGVSAEHAVYVDDRPEMVEGGRSLGITAVRFENSKQLEQDLAKDGEPS